VRNVLCQSLVAHAVDPDFAFLTGDLGFQALEPLRDAAGSRFINAGVAEQNMVGVAAGMARTGLRPWVYSIAPFVYARPYEQVRNDICMHDLPVKLVGNGGGYGYGSMGGTHHALGDYGALLCLDHMHVFVPAFAADVAAIIDWLTVFPHPAYLRLGRCELPAGFSPPPYAPWRQLLHGDGPTMVVVGPLVGSIWDAVAGLPETQRPNLWVVTELPIGAEALPADFRDQLRTSQRLVVVEEHVAQGGAGQMLLYALAAAGLSPGRFTHRYATGYKSGYSGSQIFYRQESGLDPESIVTELTS
jgi:transketolase